MKKSHLVVLVSVILVAMIGMLLYSEGFLDNLIGKEVMSAEATDNSATTDPTATAEPTATTEPTVTVAKIDGRNVLLGDEDLVIEYVSKMDQQEWLDFAIVEDEDEGYEYYGRVKDDEVIVANQDDTIVSAGEVEICEELSVLRAGNAFLVEDEFGKVTKSHGKTSYRNNKKVEVVDTMSDKEIYKTAYCEDEQAIYESAALDKVFPDAINVEGTLKIKDGFNPDLLKALVLVKYQVIDADGNEETVYAIEWHIYGCNAPIVSNTSNGGNSGNGGGGSGSSEKDPTPTATPTVTPEPTEDHQPEKTPTPTATPTVTPKPTEKHETDRTPTPTVKPTATPKPVEEHENDRTTAPTATSTPAHATTRPTSTPNNVIKEYPDAPTTTGEISKDDDVFVESTIKEYEDAPVTSGTVSKDDDVFSTDEEYSTDRQAVSVASYAVTVAVEAVEETTSTDRAVETKAVEESSTDRVPATQTNESATQGEVSTDEDVFDD